MREQEKFRHASRYFNTALENPKELAALWDMHVPPTVKFRKPLLVGRGVSGVLALGILGLHTGLPIAPVRKNLSPHSDYLIEIPPIDTNTPWIFVDDFVCSGETKEAVKERVASVPQYRGRLIGEFLYESYGPWRTE